MELSSKVRDLCQMCNWARTVTMSLKRLSQFSLAYKLIHLESPT